MDNCVAYLRRGAWYIPVTFPIFPPRVTALSTREKQELKSRLLPRLDELSLAGQIEPLHREILETARVDWPKGHRTEAYWRIPKLCFSAELGGTDGEETTKETKDTKSTSAKQKHVDFGWCFSGGDSKPISLDLRPPMI